MTMSDRLGDTEAQVEQPDRPSRRGRKVLGSVLVTAASLYLAYYLYQNRTVLVDAVRDLRPSSLVLAIMLALAMMLLKAVYHALTLRRLEGLPREKTAPGFARLLRAYAVSQMVRYLPGKVLGVVYEAEALAGAVPLHRIVMANLVQYAYTNALSIGVLLAVGAWVAWGKLWPSLLILACAPVMVWIGHRWSIVERCLSRAGRLIPRLKDLPRIVPAGGRMSLVATLLLFLEWLPFFCFWWLLLPGGQGGIAAAIVIGTSYAGASLLANLAVVMPSGLVIREALFLWIGTQMSLDAASLLLLGVLSRLLFTIADLALVPLTIALETGLPGPRND